MQDRTYIGMILEYSNRRGQGLRPGMVCLTGEKKGSGGYNRQPYDLFSAHENLQAQAIHHGFRRAIARAAQPVNGFRRPIHERCR